jgi:hypothetical protein
MNNTLIHRVINPKISGALFRRKNMPHGCSATNAFTDKNPVKTTNQAIHKKRFAKHKLSLIDALQGFTMCGLAEPGKYLRFEEFNVALIPLALRDDLFDGPDVILEQLTIGGGEI